jgi:hypothetical protein
MEEENQVSVEEKEMMITRILEYITAHPKVLYTVPGAVALYFTWPLLMLTWTWLPWALLAYTYYNTIPVAKLKKVYKYIISLKDHI